MTTSRTSGEADLMQVIDDEQAGQAVSDSAATSRGTSRVRDRGPRSSQCPAQAIVDGADVLQGIHDLGDEREDGVLIVPIQVDPDDGPLLPSRVLDEQGRLAEAERCDDCDGRWSLEHVEECLPRDRSGTDRGQHAVRAIHRHMGGGGASGATGDHRVMVGELRRSR